MITIELQNLIFYEHHGIYEEERRVMNSFEVNLSVSYRIRFRCSKRLPIPSVMLIYSGSCRKK